MNAFSTGMLLFLAAMILVPSVASGHGKMWSVEERVIGNETHSEMEELMEKMMEGSLTPGEEDRLVDLRTEIPRDTAP